jgi:hypothetical protein
MQVIFASDFLWSADFAFVPTATSTIINNMTTGERRDGGGRLIKDVVEFSVI